MQNCDTIVVNMDRPSPKEIKEFMEKLRKETDDLNRAVDAYEDAIREEKEMAKLRKKIKR